jgi:hypothetical protein
MTYALVLVKGKAVQREDSLSFLEELSKDTKFSEETHVKIERIFISFGWPDFVLLLKSENVELIKHAIVVIRDLLAKNGDTIETSTLVCATQEEIEEKRRKWAAISSG